MDLRRNGFWYRTVTDIGSRLDEIFNRKEVIKNADFVQLFAIIIILKKDKFGKVAVKTRFSFINRNLDLQFIFNRNRMSILYCRCMDKCI